MEQGLPKSSAEVARWTRSLLEAVVERNLQSARRAWLGAPGREVDAYELCGMGVKSPESRSRIERALLGGEMGQAESVPAKRI